MDTTRGMKLSQLESFCKSQCPGAENKLQFGLGHFNHGFKTHSSIFYLNSLFYFKRET